MKDIEAVLLCTGSELLSGKSNTYAPAFAESLKEHGIRLRRESCLRDSTGDIAAAVKDALKTTDIVILCGGLGPTFDDVTREGVSEALNIGLKTSPEIMRVLQHKFRKHRVKMCGIGEKQALVLDGAEILGNHVGSAPGQYLVKVFKGRKKFIVLLPGPLNEWYPMWRQQALPAISKTFNSSEVNLTVSLRIAGMSESEIECALKPVLDKLAGAEATILTGTGYIDMYFTCRGEKTAECRGKLKILTDRCREILGDRIFGSAGDTLESVIGHGLRKKKMTLSAAESCTGGLVSHRITEIAGSSDYFKGTVVAYSNEVKSRLLKVKDKTLLEHGAVSPECAVEMARGIRKLLGTDFGLAITGIAGPGGGTEKKPVGLVFISVSSKKGDCCERHIFSGSRSAVKAKAASTALNLLRLQLQKL